MNLVETAADGAVPIVPVIAGELPDGNGWARATGFEARPGDFRFVPDEAGSLAGVLVGLDPSRNMWSLAGLPASLPEGDYRVDAPGLDSHQATLWSLGWSLGCYAFDRYAAKPRPGARLVVPDGVDLAEVERCASGIALVRDLINTPACDLGPRELAETARAVAGDAGASISVIEGADLLVHGYPSIHAVGRAAARPPCLIDMRWGEPGHPAVTLVGKGVCFDSGGLDIKSAAGMLHMKKDMGGAAQVLGLARMIMGAGLPVRLRVLIPAVENAISGDAFRPRDVLQTRKGLTVEVGNTDAEGRLILSDALAEAAGERPEMIVDYATLTGAARVALGADLPALFCNDDMLAGEILQSGEEQEDPLWRMPLWPGYHSHIDSKVADVSSTGTGGLGGAIIAALFLERFVQEDVAWAHIDLIAYNQADRPGRPEGGEAQALRAVYGMIRSRFG